MAKKLTNIALVVLMAAAMYLGWFLVHREAEDYRMEIKKLEKR